MAFAGWLVLAGCRRAEVAAWFKNGYSCNELSRMSGTLGGKRKDLRGGMVQTEDEVVYMACRGVNFTFRGVKGGVGFDLEGWWRPKASTETGVVATVTMKMEGSSRIMVLENATDWEE